MTLQRTSLPGRRGTLRVIALAVLLAAAVTAGSLLGGGPAQPALAQEPPAPPPGVPRIYPVGQRPPIISAGPAAAAGGLLYICKVSGPGPAYTYTVNARTTFTVPTQYCVYGGQFPLGTLVTVRETIPAGERATVIDIEPTNRLVGRPNLATGTVTGRIGAGVTEAHYTNDLLPPTTQLRLCNVAGESVAVGTRFSFTVARQSVVLAAGAAPAGTCRDFTFNVGAAVPIDEVVPFNMLVAAIDVSPAGAVTTAPDLKAGSVTVTVTEPTTVTYTNRMRPRPGSQGCSAAFFQSHPEAFTAPQTPDRAVGSVFRGVAPSLAPTSLMDALAPGSGTAGTAGAQETLMRQAVAALLNASHPDVSYVYTPAQVISQVNVYIASRNTPAMLSLAARLEGYNNRGCPLG